jgi:methionine--tRNA ligase
MIYITTPIYYPNDRPHLGTAYTTLVADAVARYWRLKGEEVFSLTGTDEHGLKIARAAEENGMSPQEWVDHIVERFYEAWAMLDIEYDDFIRTTEPRHTGAVRKLLGVMHDAGDVYEHRYEGPYCVACEAYYTEAELVDGHCPIHERPIEIHAEDNYFFKLSAYGDRLLAHIEANPDFVTPVTRRNEVVSFIEQGLEDISISRANLEWGIPLPWDETHVAYVWVDALINYASAAGFLDDDGRFAGQWPAWAHLVGKDIIRFHAIIWPAIDVGGASIAQADSLTRLPAGGWPEDVQDAGQSDTPRGPGAYLWFGRLSLPLPAGCVFWAGWQLLVGRHGRPLQRRSGQRLRQSGQPCAQPGRTFQGRAGTSGVRPRRHRRRRLA